MLLIKIITALLSGALMLGTWFTFATVDARLTNDQRELMEQAQIYIDNGIYHRAIATLNSAMIFGHENNSTIQYAIAELQLQSGNIREYRNLMHTIVNSANLPEGVSLAQLYHELYDFYTRHERLDDTIALLATAASRTGDQDLFRLYQSYRYLFRERRGVYQHVDMTHQAVARFKQGDLYGFITGAGTVIRPPVYELATNMFNNQAVVYRDGVLEIINRGGQRQALAGFDTNGLTNIKRFTGDSFAINFGDGYRFATWTAPDVNFHLFEIEPFEYVGLTTEGVRALKRGGLWSLDGVNFVYPSVAMDQRGRVAVNGRVFVREANAYYMRNLEGDRLAGPFQDARPFFETGGLAAVKQQGYWGLIDNQGNVIVDFGFDDAQSSSMGLAAVAFGGQWGYLSVADYPEEFRHEFFARLVIEPQFFEARPFVNGVAPIRTESGWAYISLIAFE